MATSEKEGRQSLEQSPKKEEVPKNGPQQSQQIPPPSQIQQPPSESLPPPPGTVNAYGQRIDYDQQTQYADQPQNYGQPPQYGENNTKPCNPCCCCELHCGVLFVGIVGIIFYILVTVHTCLYWGDVNYLKLDNNYRQTTAPEALYLIFTYFLGLIFAIVLTVAAANKSVGMAKASFGGYIAVLIMFMIGIIIQICLDVKETLDYESVSGWRIVIFGLAIIITLVVYIYVVYVIHAYAKQLTRTGQQMMPMDAPYYGQYPAGPPPPTPQMSYYYQPAYPSVGYSQTTMEQGQGQGIPTAPQPVAQGPG